jgi:hypothetical protein
MKHIFSGGKSERILSITRVGVFYGGTLGLVVVH